MSPVALGCISAFSIAEIVYFKCFSNEFCTRAANCRSAFWLAGVFARFSAYYCKHGARLWRGRGKALCEVFRIFRNESDNIIIKKTLKAKMTSVKHPWLEFHEENGEIDGTKYVFVRGQVSYCIDSFIRIVQCTFVQIFMSTLTLITTYFIVGSFLRFLSLTSGKGLAKSALVRSANSLA